MNVAKATKVINQILNQQLQHQQVCRRINPIKFKQRHMKVRHKIQKVR